VRVCIQGARVDCVIVNSGTLRADDVFPAGAFLMKDLVTLLPMLDELCVLGLTGAQLLDALENGVCMYPRLEGRFPQVSGVRFMFNPEAEPNHRVVQGSVFVGDEALDLGKEYKVATKAYLRHGKDGYTVFPKARLIADEEDCPVIPTVIRNQFKALRVLNMFGMNATDNKRLPIKAAAMETFKSTVWFRRHSQHPVALETPDTRRTFKYKINPTVEGRITMGSTPGADAVARMMARSATRLGIRESSASIANTRAETEQGSVAFSMPPAAATVKPIEERLAAIESLVVALTSAFPAPAAIKATCVAAGVTEALADAVFATGKFGKSADGSHVLILLCADAATSFKETCLLFADKLGREDPPPLTMDEARAACLYLASLDPTIGEEDAQGIAERALAPQRPFRNRGESVYQDKN